MAHDSTPSLIKQILPPHQRVRMFILARFKTLIFIPVSTPREAKYFDFVVAVGCALTLPPTMRIIGTKYILVGC